MEPLEEENARLRHRVAELEAANQRLERRIQELLQALEEVQRAAKRQAAPFSRRGPKAHPAKPGRKAGAKYSRRCRRPIPIDQRDPHMLTVKGDPSLDSLRSDPRYPALLKKMNLAEAFWATSQRG